MKVKRKKHLTRNFVAAATFLIASSITIGFSFPTFASNIPIVGNVFELFYDDEEYIFEKYDEFSSKLGITQESNGVEVTLTDAVYDGENITVAYTLKSNQNLGKGLFYLGILSLKSLKMRINMAGSQKII